ncbi:MAG: DUF2974 domain-containing protein [Coriobacteriaceae bacterium]|nr:DUF2974 domain-containing protein [Coriobacteriaceae bacterium]
MDDKRLGVLKGRESANFLTYVQGRFDTFAERPLCAVDSLVFSWLAYTHLNAALDAACTAHGIALHELLRAEDFADMFGTSWDPQGSLDLLFAVCASPRFRDVRLTEFRFKTDMGAEEQFAAMTFALPDGSSYVAFRGTDSTLVGWKEDFNMTFLNPVPAQQEAARYLAEVARSGERPLYVGGHSKGGNLAIYAAAACAPQCGGRIARVFSHDGPGFHREYIADEAYRRIMPLVEKTVPKAAMISQVLSEDPALACTVVESDSFSLLQHNPFMWHVDLDTCAFVEADGLSTVSRYFGSTLDAWMDKYPLEDRRRFVDTLFDVIGVTGATRFGDIMADAKTNIPMILAAAEGLDPEMSEFIIDVVKTFARTATVEKVGDAVSDAASGLLDTIKSVKPTFGKGGEGLGADESTPDVY